MLSKKKKKKRIVNDVSPWKIRREGSFFFFSRAAFLSIDSRAYCGRTPRFEKQRSRRLVKSAAAVLFRPTGETVSFARKAD